MDFHAYALDVMARLHTEGLPSTGRSAQAAIRAGFRAGLTPAACVETFAHLIR